jgi:hypothetical protein
MDYVVSWSNAVPIHSLLPLLAQVQEETYGNIKAVLGKLDGMIVPVVTGFIGEGLRWLGLV